MSEEHVTFVKAAREKALGQWGVSAGTEKEALSKINPSDAASMLFVRMVEQAIGVWAKDRDLSIGGHRNEELCDPGDGSKKLPDAKIGSLLYVASHEDEWQVERYVVIHVDDNGHALVVRSGERDFSHIYCTWADEDFFLSAREAIEHKMKEEVDYYKRHLDSAKSAGKLTDSEIESLVF